MVVDYPGLRRRPPRGVETPAAIPTPPPSLPAVTSNHPRRRRWKLSQLYFTLSVSVAILAVVASTAEHRSAYYPNPATTGENPPFWNLFFSKEPPPEKETKRAPAWIRWALPKKEQEKDATPPPQSPWIIRMMDPTILSPGPTTFTDLLDKILTSTPRILAIANLLLSLTYLVHTAVANLFLDLPSLSRESWAGRERLGGFLVFKLLLISAVVAPDTLDLLILLSWYTLLSFLRSLAGLAAATTAHTSQSGQSPRKGVLSLLVLVLFSDIVAASCCVALFHGAGWGMVVLLTCDCALLAVDVISHILRHVTQTIDLHHSMNIQRLEARQLVLHSQVRQQEEEQNNRSTNDITEEEEREGTQQCENVVQGAVRLTVQNQNGDQAVLPEDEQITIITETSFGQQDQEPRASNQGVEELLSQQENPLLEESRRLDQQMEVMEVQHNRRLLVLESSVFYFQLLAYTLTILHFLHIWSLHGLQFTLIDGVLALHLHSALSAAGKKIAERRNLNRIARDLDAMFEDATEIELSKSTDIFCCICLGTMSTGSVKKVGCGHFYHTHCLREVVERARSIEAAKCPLCRASVVNGEPSETPPSEEEANNNNGVNNNNNAAIGEDALFRFSTEGILPAWMPLPAFSFEVVRRPAVDTNSNNNATQTGTDDENNTPGENAGEESEQPRTPPQQQQRQPSFFRRLLVLAGIVPMSAEEEGAALEQLVDMFPQYDRADLLRELRSRGSAEGVVESVLMGVFQGVTRGASNTNGVAPASNGREELETPEGANNQEGGRSMEQATVLEVY
mmetsp:Transcript_22036/g.32553  ORF Transcript_22036/g.32553 Transcript_22036/m.32553 type:complete len:794 (+) Transcript_22036:202-2583(+)|eukprot:CAMPEP_0194221468 /NCGR_PEP_ID=MMETSP0156-20130528/30632_1 /TAXON_ID=33649 /ORGANISM="Thalassionema nitzschioides, Strain L26-B" /LENGTH=793 /DNA_ID=CAMNT_0038951871 /DNA_START=163 /DNA_END=2544 /DNA_ORIENTATION=+